MTWPVVASAFFLSPLQEAPQKIPAEPEEAELRYGDGSVIRAAILQDRIEVQTEFGKLSIAPRDIRSIDFGVHLPDGADGRIQDAVKQLASSSYRLRDADQGYPLRALLRVVGEQAVVVEQDIAGLYENWFIETCDEWVVPYIGELLGTPGLSPSGGEDFSQRAYVANTLAYRRRKGTAAVLEQLARDVTGWPARVLAPASSGPRVWTSTRRSRARSGSQIWAITRSNCGARLRRPRLGKWVRRTTATSSVMDPDRSASIRAWT